MEIEADYGLLVEHQIAESIDKYKRLTNDDVPLQSQLRAHWMLAGIYAGDWSVDKAHLDSKLARDHVVQILSNWPDSPEALLLKQWLRWDDSKHQTNFDYLPQMNVKLSEVTEV